MPSTEFQKLGQALSDLKAGLMSFAPREDGAYTPEELLKCQAFIVFSHAEVETYLERISTRILSEAKNRWASEAVYDRVIATLLAFHRQIEATIPNDPKDLSKKSNIKLIIEAAFKAQTEVISDNNGIKRSNLSAMLCPLGVLPDDLEEILLIQLDNTGKLRGDLVHKESRVSLRNIRDPFNGEQQDIDDLFEEIRKLDSKLEALNLLSVPAA